VAKQKNESKAEPTAGTEPEASGTPPTETPAPNGESKRTVVRRPLWVCVPKPADPLDDPSAERLYYVDECHSKKEVLAVFAKRGVDVTNIETVRMFRANPMDFKIGTQVTIKF